MSKIFLNYRHEDSGGYAGRLHDGLASHFGEDSVFQDVTAIKPGIDFVEAIKKSIESCAVMVVVIGQGWSSSLFDREKSQHVDYLRLEISMALKQQIPILPVLVARAAMPREEELPDDLRALGRIQAFELREAHFHIDIKILIEDIEDLICGPRTQRRTQPTQSQAEPTLSVVGLEEVLAWGWDGTRLLEELFALDQMTIADFDPNYTGTVAQWVPIMMNHPYTWRLIIDRPGSIVGNWHYISLTDAEKRRALKGMLREREITEDKVRYMDMRGWYDIYFVAVFLLPRFRLKLQNLLLLRRSILDHFTELARDGVFMNRIFAHAYSPAGESFCRSFDMKPGVKHVDHGRIYSRKFYPLPELPIFDEYSELEELYANAIKTRRR